MNLVRRIVVGALVMLLAAVPLHAAIKAAAALPGNHNPAITGTVTIMSVTWSGAGRVAVSYSAECAHGGTTIDWLSIQIIVDGVTLPPTAGTLDAFCAGDGTTSIDGWATHSMEAATGVLGTGSHTATVTATSVNNSGTPGNAGWLGDSSLVVKK